MVFDFQGIYIYMILHDVVIFKSLCHHSSLCATRLGGARNYSRYVHTSVDMSQLSIVITPPHSHSHSSTLNEFLSRTTHFLKCRVISGMNSSMAQTTIGIPSTESIMGIFWVRKGSFIPERTCLYQLMTVLYVTVLRKTCLWWSWFTFLYAESFPASYSASFLRLQHVIPGIKKLFPPFLPQTCVFLFLPLPCPCFSMYGRCVPTFGINLW